LISPEGKTIFALFFSKFKFNNEQNVPAALEYLKPSFSKSSTLKKIAEYVKYFKITEQQVFDNLINFRGLIEENKKLPGFSSCEAKI
jgi:hypothetical protein